MTEDYKKKIRDERTCSFPGCKRKPEGIVENEKTGELYLVCYKHAQEAVEIQETLNEKLEAKDAEEKA